MHSRIPQTELFKDRKPNKHLLFILKDSVAANSRMSLISASIPITSVLDGSADVEESSTELPWYRIWLPIGDAAQEVLK